MKTTNNLIKCKSCGNEISRIAKSCPKCGEPSQSTKIVKAGLGMMGLGLSIMILIPVVIFFIIILAALI